MDCDDETRVVEEVRKVFSKTNVPTVYALIGNITRLGYEDDIQTATEKICNFLLETGDLYDAQENDMPQNETSCVEESFTYVADSAPTDSQNVPKIEKTLTEKFSDVKITKLASGSKEKVNDVKINELASGSKETIGSNSLPTGNNTVECGCCFNDTLITAMAQCYEGHLFCFKCLERYTQECVFGQGKCLLICMSADCGVSFPKSQLSLALKADLYKKYEDQISLESVNNAALENFVRCKFCNYGAELDPRDQYFSCSQCFKNFCRKCQELYDDHKGLTCEEIEKNAEKDIRKSYEEKMTEAKIRTCTKCKSRFTKSSGCNKITCRCSTSMCYVCRTPNVKYNHFCQHERLNKEKCHSCNRPCYLWSNADEDDQMAIEELRKQANGVRNQEGFAGKRLIGAPSLSNPVAQAQAEAQPELEDIDDEYDEHEEYSSDENDILDQVNYNANEEPYVWGMTFDPIAVQDENADEWYNVLNSEPEHASEDDNSSNYADVEDEPPDNAEFDAMAQQPQNDEINFPDIDVEGVNYAAEEYDDVYSHDDDDEANIRDILSNDDVESIHDVLSNDDVESIHDVLSNDDVESNHDCLVNDDAGNNHHFLATDDVESIHDCLSDDHEPYDHDYDLEDYYDHYNDYNYHDGDTLEDYY